MRLLKTLEEPPEHAHFVLATTEPYKLPPTIRSRTQRFDFHPVGSEVLIEHLSRIATLEGYQVDRDALSLMARHARGSVRDALGLLEQVSALSAGKVNLAGVTRALGLADADTFARLCSAIADQDAPAALTLVAEIAGQGADLRRYTADALEFFRGIFLAQYAPNLEEIVDEPADVLDGWRAMARSLDSSDVLRAIDQLGDALVALREGREERLVLELTLLRSGPPRDGHRSGLAVEPAGPPGGPGAAAGRADRPPHRAESPRPAPRPVAAPRSGTGSAAGPAPPAPAPRRNSEPRRRSRSEAATSPRPGRAPGRRGRRRCRRPALPASISPPSTRCGRSWSRRCARRRGRVAMPSSGRPGRSAWRGPSSSWASAPTSRSISPSCRRTIGSPRW